MIRRLTVALLFAGTCGCGWASDALDRLDQALEFHSPGGFVRAHVSGLLDLEAYAFEQPAPAFLDASGHSLFNPRLSAFLDAQIGPTLYLFAQARVDRGFDPGADALRGRLDEYALRFTPDPKGRFSLQVGRFATIVGGWVPRHLSWDNPFVTAPLPYENLTGIWDVIPAPSVPVLLTWAHVQPPPTATPNEEKYLQLPIIWGPSYATGIAASGQLGAFDYAAELKARSLASRPSTWSTSVLSTNHPTVSVRLGFQPNAMWAFGASASSGSYLEPSAAPLLPAGTGLGDYRQRVLAQDVAFAWHHLQIWAELFECRFEIPRVGNADTLGGYIEAKYKLTPQLYAAGRWNQQLFSTMTEGGISARWGANAWRADLAIGYRASVYTEFKLQVSVQRATPSAHRFEPLLAFQLVQKF